MAWNVLILGGGFGGLYTARKLEKLLPDAADPGLDEQSSGGTATDGGRSRDATAR